VLIVGVGRAAEPQEVHFRSPIEKLGASRSATDIAAIFESRGYDLRSVRESGTCPRLFLHDIPLDMDGVEPVQAKKGLFIALLLPLVLKANEVIAEQRETLLQLRERNAKGGKVTAAEQSWLQSMADLYAAEPEDLDELVARVDIVPPSLALAQGIDESGWGTSRFAREGESLFGQHASADAHAKIRATSASAVGVAAFSGMPGSVQSYLHNLTTRSLHRIDPRWKQCCCRSGIRRGSIRHNLLLGFALRILEYGVVMAGIGLFG